MGPPYSTDNSWLGKRWTWQVAISARSRNYLTILSIKLGCGWMLRSDYLHNASVVLDMPNVAVNFNVMLKIKLRNLTSQVDMWVAGGKAVKWNAIVILRVYGGVYLNFTKILHLSLKRTLDWGFRKQFLEITKTNLNVGLLQYFIPSNKLLIGAMHLCQNYNGRV